MTFFCNESMAQRVDRLTHEITVTEEVVRLLESRSGNRLSLMHEQHRLKRQHEDLTFAEYWFKKMEAAIIEEDDGAYFLPEFHTDRKSKDPDDRRGYANKWCSLTSISYYKCWPCDELAIEAVTMWLLKS